MKSDLQIQQDVQDELQWDPILKAAEIGVAVKNGIVTLNGSVDSYSKKIAAEDAVKRVKDVKAVALDLEVVFPGTIDHKSDASLAAVALDALKWTNFVPEDRIQLKVDDGHLTLEGELEWQYQRDAAFNAVKNLQGVRSVINKIHIKPGPSASIIKDNIRKALSRDANIEANNINVETKDRTIVLKGKVRSWSERSDVERAVWSTPGVLAVQDELTVS